MEYEEKCDFCMSQLVIIKYREILKILEENSNVISQRKSTLFIY